MRDLIAKAVVTVPIVNEITGQGIITALHLENSVWLGMTYGAWFKIGLGVALLLLIVERTTTIYNNIKNSNKTADNE